jgi:hypothetical protein
MIDTSTRMQRPFFTWLGFTQRAGRQDLQHLERRGVTHVCFPGFNAKTMVIRNDPPTHLCPKGNRVAAAAIGGQQQLRDD